MTYICPRSSCSILSSSLLWVHLKFKHSYTRNETTHCHQPECTRIYKNLYDYKKHIQIAHPQNINTVDHANCAKKNIEIRIHDANDNGNAVNVSFDDVLNVTPSNDTNNDEIENLSELQDMVTNGALTFIAKLYSNNNVTHSVIQDLINYTSEFIGSNCVGILKKVHANGTGEENNKLFNSAIEIFSNPFKGLETEYKRQQYLEKSGHLVRSQKFLIGTTERSSSKKANSYLDLKDVTGQIIPLRESLKKFLELPNVFSTIESYIWMIAYSVKKITSFVNAELWRETLSKFNG